MFSSSRKNREIPIRLSLSDTNRLSDRNVSPKFEGHSSVTTTASAIEQSAHRRRQGVHTAPTVDYVSNFGCKFRDNVRRIDYILAYVEKAEEQQSKDEKDRESVRNYFEKRLQQDGVDIEVDRINEKDEETLVFVKLHATWSALCRYAERLQMKCPLWLRDKPNINEDSLREDEVYVCDRSGERGFTPRGGSCVAINDGGSEGKPVGGSGRSGNKFHWAEKSCRHNRGAGRSVLLWYCSPQASNPLQYQCGHVMQNGQLLFLVRGVIIFAKILVQSEGGIHCANVKDHKDGDTKAAEEVDQNHFVQRTQCEKLNGWIDMQQMARRQ
uniref:Anoctamin dimerisation domain-containing protein n=1 Tax=Romanomermis culicivorax TaxID=13658 RepID=A0A915L745_ROMCU